MLDVLYVFKFDESKKDKAIKRLNCSITNLQSQGARINLLNASEYDLLDCVRVDNYIHKPYAKYFNKSILINYAVKNMIKSEYFIFSDIDLVYKDGYIDGMNQYANSKKAVRVVPYNVNCPVEMYSNVYTAYTYKMDEANVKGWAHGNGLIHTESFMNIRGYNEIYLGYGPEDQEFNLRISKICETIYDDKLKDVHIWHEQMNREYIKDNHDNYDRIKIEIEKGKLIYNSENWGEY